MSDILLSDFSNSVELPSKAARGLLDAELGARRAALREVVGRNPNGKLAKRAGVLLLDMNVLEDRIEEMGGAEGFLFFLTAQVMSGVTLRVMCEHYGLEEGLLGAWLLAEPERMQRYVDAQRWVADGYVAEVVGIADEADPVEGVAKAKLQGEMRLKAAGLMDRRRFGMEKVGLSGGGSAVIDAALTIAAAELLGRIRPLQVEKQERVIEPVAEQTQHIQDASQDTDETSYI